MSLTKVDVAQVFILGTGRCGTETAAKLLNQIPGCSVLHEAKPSLLQESRDYASDGGNLETLHSLLKQTRSVEALGGKLLAGESNQRLSFIMPALNEVFPNARFLWFIRDGRDTVASLHHRFVYDPNEAAKRSPALRERSRTRIRADEVGEMSTADWERIDGFARCCWYWSFTNRIIKRDSQRLNLPIRLCRLERLKQELPEILEFLDLSLEKMPSTVPRTNRTSGLQPLPWRYWSKRDMKVFDQFAGTVMDEHYPGWREEMRQPFTTRFAGLVTRTARGIRRSAARACGKRKWGMKDRGGEKLER